MLLAGPIDKNRVFPFWQCPSVKMKIVFVSYFLHYKDTVSANGSGVITKAQSKNFGKGNIVLICVKYIYTLAYTLICQMFVL